MKMQLRAVENEDGKRYIEGYAALFNSQSRMLFEDKKLFREIIEIGAFDSVLRSENLNAVANVDHSMAKMLGRTKSGTLILSTDSRGLRYEIEVPNTQLGNDTYEQVQRGDLFESSFAFGTLKSDVRWGRDRKDGTLLRYVSNIQYLKDVSIVMNGAYAKTDIEARSLEYIGEVSDNLKEGLECSDGLCQRVASDFNDETEVRKLDEIEKKVETPIEEKKEESDEKSVDLKNQEREESAEKKKEAEEIKVPEKKEEVIPKVEIKEEVKVEKPAEIKEEIPSWKDEVGDRESRLIKTMLN